MVIKPDCAAGNSGLKVVRSLEEAMKVLSSGKAQVDMLVEELIRGETFSVEIYGVPGNYSVTPAIRLYTGEDGVTDPVFGVKYGPILDKNMKLRSCIRK